MRIKIRKNDVVNVITGKDRGKSGKVLRVFPDGKLIVEKINFVYFWFYFPKSEMSQRKSYKNSVSFFLLLKETKLLYDCLLIKSTVSFNAIKTTCQICKRLITLNYSINKFRMSESWCAIACHYGVLQTDM